MSIIEWICELLIGGFLMWTGYQIGYKKNLSLLHRTHTVNVSEEDKKPFSRGMGTGSFAIGAGIFFMPIINTLIGNQMGYKVGLALILLGVFLMLHMVFNFNGSLFGNSQQK